MMTRIQIKGAIMAATGKSIEAVAREHGYSKHAFYYTIKGRSKGRAIREIISRIIGLQVSEIWPEQAEEE